MQAEWEPDELIGAWTLTGGDWDLIVNKAGVTRLGCGDAEVLRGPVPGLSRGSPARCGQVSRVAGEGLPGAVRQVLLGGPVRQVPPVPDTQGARAERRNALAATSSTGNAASSVGTTRSVRKTSSTASASCYPLDPADIARLSPLGHPTIKSEWPLPYHQPPAHHWAPTSARGLIQDPARILVTGRFRRPP